MARLDAKIVGSLFGIRATRYVVLITDGNSQKATSAGRSC